MKTYGTAELIAKNTKWQVRAEAHVIIMMKRIFSGAAQERAGVLHITVNDENCRLLHWAMQLYPLECPDGEYLQNRVTVTRERMRELARIVQPGYQPREFAMAVPPREYQRLAAELFLTGKRLLLADDLGLGKQQPVDTNVLTPSGYRQIGSLVVGSSVIGSDGKATQVLGIYPQGVQPSYRVTFSDHSSVEAGPEHLWTFWYRCGGRRWDTLTLQTQQLLPNAVVTREIAGRPCSMRPDRTSLYLPMLSAPVQFQSASPLPIPPYTLGLMLANGSLAHGHVSISTNTMDWEQVRQRIESESVSIGAVQVYGGTTRAGLIGLTGPTRELGLNILSGQKFIPSVYLRAAIPDRIELLHGLMDADGSISKERNRVTYHTTSTRLAVDVQTLVEQLGGIASIRPYDRTDEGKPLEYQVRIRVPAAIRPFIVDRKNCRFRPSQRTLPVRTVVSVEYVRDVESVCIRVAAEDALYATEHAILTHNTASAICALCDPATLPALVICPTHLPRQWQAELNRFLPDLKTHIIKSVKPYALDQDNPPDVLITTYHKIHGWDTTLKGYIKTMICDEMQELRHNGTDKYEAARRISRECEYRLGLSATPIYNYGGEIFNPLTILDPDLLGTREEFDREWCRFSGRHALLKDPKAFNAWMRDQKIMLKRTRSEVSRELPPLTKIVYLIDADAEALNSIQTTAAELARIMLSEERLSGLTKMQAAGDFDMMVRQATGIAKAPHVAAFVELLLESGEPVVLFAWHRAVHDLLKDRLAKYNPVFYTGEESANQKFNSLQAFINGETNLIIISLRSGAGIDGLQKRCRTVVIGELDWSPQVIDQDIGRVDRDGQKDPVTAYILVTDSGSDPVISEMLGLKKEQSDGLLNIETDVLEIQTDQSNSLKLLAEQYLNKAKATK